MKRALYSQSRLPLLQNQMFENAQDARICAVGDVDLVEDLESGLVYNAAFDPSLLTYTNDYQNEQGYSVTFKEHLEAVSAIIFDHMDTSSLVEVGCGKGRFLELLASRGAQVHGYDPTYEGDNPRIVREFFGPNAKIRASGLIMRHVLEHIQNPFEFLEMLAAANGGKGLIYIEVPCFDWICRNKTWYDVFYEHVNYFRMSDFHRMFGRVLFAERVFGEQYLAVVADLESLRKPEFDPADRANLPADFAPAVRANETGRPKVIWGGASKGVIFSIFCARSGIKIDTVVDISPSKQGKYLAVTGHKVQAPDVLNALGPSDIYIMNPNYKSEIVAHAGPQHNYMEI